MTRIVKNRLGNILLIFLIFTIITGWFFTGWPQIWRTPSIPPEIQEAKAANFQMQTGYYVGTGVNPFSITGLGFQPQLVIIKADTTAGIGAVWKSSNMAVNTTAYFPATANDTASQITLNSDGFTVSASANVNTAGVVWKWIAFAGSDCSSAGTFCVGNYTGNGAVQSIASVGFQPDLVWVKGSGATAATWRSSAMGNNVGQYFTATTQNTTGALFQTLNPTGFTVGTTNSANGIIYQYVAFKNVTGLMNVGTYSGNATDNRNITVSGFSSTAPNFVFLKNANAATAVAPVFNITDSYGDYSNLFTDAASVVDNIQSLQLGGFQVGTASAANGSGNTIFYVAFAGAVNYTGSNTFKMAAGYYSGNGTSQTISGLGFAPDLVIIKGDTVQQGVFRTKMMPGDSTAYLGAATANFTGGVTSLVGDGFVVGASATVNSSGITYYWEAFGNASNPMTNSGAADFAIGAYTGNGIDNRNINRQPFQPNLVAIKRSGATAGAWRSSIHSGDSSSYFAATADTADIVQTINSDGFQIGINAAVNTAANIYWWFAFKSGSNFTVNSYTGSGSAQNITTAGFQPDLVWIKRSTAVNGVFRSSSLSGNSTQYFVNLANVSDRITGFISNGFSIGGAQTETNTSGGTYRYAAWATKKTITVGATGNQIANMNIPSINNYVGGAFTFITDRGIANVTQIIITETGTVNANSNLSNAKLYYDTANCTYEGTEPQFGSAASFNSSEKATFSGTMPVGTSQVCVYVVLDVGSGASSGQILEIEISNPSTEVTVSAGNASPATAVAIGGTTTLQLPAVITVSATSNQTASMNIPSTNNYVGGAFTFVRNVGSATTTQIIITETGTVNANSNLSNAKLYYDTTNCTYEGTEPQFGSAASFNSSEKATFSGTMPVGTSQVCVYVVLDVGSGASSGQTLEIEISNPSTEVTVSAGNASPATAVAIGGTTTLQLPAVITVGATGNQTASMNIPSTNNYVGGAFTFVRNVGSATTTQIIITETGTVNANSNLSNVKFYYKQEAICSASIPGDATPFNNTGVGFNGSEKAIVNADGIGMPVGTSQVCVYVVLDVGSGASSGQTLEIEISNPSTEVTVSAGNVSPATAVAIGGITNLISAATWLAAENSSTTIGINQNIRLRIQISNTGTATTSNYRLEYASKNGAICGDNETFIIIPVTPTTEHFKMATSSYVTNNNPTNQRLSNPGHTFVSGKIVADPANSSGNFNLDFEYYTEFEFVFKAISGASGIYCFRSTNAGTLLDEYVFYPELEITP